MSQAVCSVPGRQEDREVFIDPPTNLDRPVNRLGDLEACRSLISQGWKRQKWEAKPVCHWKLTGLRKKHELVAFYLSLINLVLPIDTVCSWETLLMSFLWQPAVLDSGVPAVPSCNCVYIYECDVWDFWKKNVHNQQKCIPWTEKQKKVWSKKLQNNHGTKDNLNTQKCKKC